MALTPLPNIGLFKRIINVAWASRNPIIIVITQLAEDEPREVPAGPLSGQLIDNRTILDIDAPLWPTEEVDSFTLQEAKFLQDEADVTIPPSSDAGAPAVSRTINQDMLDFYYAWSYPVQVTQWGPDRGFSGRTNFDPPNPDGPIGEDTMCVTVINLSKILLYLIDNMTAEEYAEVVTIDFRLIQSFIPGIPADDDAHHVKLTSVQTYRIKPGNVTIEEDGQVDLGIGSRALEGQSENYGVLNGIPPGSGNPKRTFFANNFDDMRFRVNKLTGSVSYIP